MTDNQTIEQLLNQHWSLLARVASAYEYDLAIREELLQEIALAIWQAMPKFRGDSSVKSYILRIAHLRGASHIDKQCRQLKTQPDDIETPHPSNLSKHIENNQQIEHLMQAIRTLPIVQRQLVTLALDGVKYHEMAEIIGISPSNVGVSLNRAKQALKQKMEEM